MSIIASVVQDSVCNGKRITTFELEYPRFIHSEFMTHRLFSRNAASSRAIPVSKMLGLIELNPAMPVHWGKNEPGMQAWEELPGELMDVAVSLWRKGAREVASLAKSLADIGVHKQVVNRILEPFQIIKVVVTATEYDNFFWLRNHPDAQPEIKALAGTMLHALDGSKPFKLNAGEWHVPYVNRDRNQKGEIVYSAGPTELSVEDALKVSSSCCAQVSYRLLDTSIEKALFVYRRLVESEPVHASPFEHQARAMEFVNIKDQDIYLWDVFKEGATHIDRNGDVWSGNLCGYVQHRQLIPNNACWDYRGT